MKLGRLRGTILLLTLTVFVGSLAASSGVLAAHTRAAGSAAPNRHFVGTLTLEEHRVWALKSSFVDEDGARTLTGRAKVDLEVDANGSVVKSKVTGATFEGSTHLIESIHPGSCNINDKDSLGPGEVTVGGSLAFLTTSWPWSDDQTDVGTCTGEPAGHVVRIFAWTPSCKTSDDGKDGTITYNSREQPPVGTGGVGSTTVYTCKGTLKGASRHSISGTVRGLLCGQSGSCELKPISGVTVTATSSSGDGTDTTKADGTYTIDGLDPAHYQVKVDPSYTSDPRSATASTFDGNAEDVNFTVCKENDTSSKALTCFPEFNYTMEERLSKTGDPSTAKAADFNPKSYPVTFTILGGSCDTSADYAWSVDGAVTKAKPAGRCAYVLDFDKLGKYRVKVEQTSADQGVAKKVYAKTVTVQDFVIASLGDSLAAGEGDGNYTDSTLGTSLCHRSKSAYGAQVAQKAEDADKRTSVTFVHLACTGASLAGGLKDQNIDNQVDSLKELIGDRKIDLLTITIGINDVNFGDVIKFCWRDFACQKRFLQESGAATKYLYDGLVKYAPKTSDLYKGITGKEFKVKTLGDLEQALFDDLPDKYGQLRAKLRSVFPRSQLNSNDIYFIAYPDPLLDPSGKPCSVLIPNKLGALNAGVALTGTAPSGGGFEDANDEHEVTWAQDSIVKPLTEVERRVGQQWTLLPPPGEFAAHGYCAAGSWWVSVSEALSNAHPSGAMHPTTAGQDAIAEALYGAVRGSIFHQ